MTFIRQKPRRTVLIVALALGVSACSSNSGPAPSNGSGGGTGGANRGGAAGAAATGGSADTGGLSSSGGRSGAGGVSATGGAGTGGAPSGGNPGAAGGTASNGGSTGTRDAGFPDDVASGGAGADGPTGSGGGGNSGGSASGGAGAGLGGSAGGAGGSSAGPSGGGAAGARTGGSTSNRDGGTSSAGVQGSGGSPATDASAIGGSAAGGSATGGSAAGGSTDTVAACATNEVGKCTSGTGPLGAEIKCDFGGGDGNYDVTVELGGSAAGDTFVDAEMYRRMLPELTTIAGQTRRFGLTVNVRTPEGQPVEVGNTDSVPGLQVYFRGPNPKVNAICHQTASKPLMLWLGGDSTVCDQDSTNYTGWGQRLPQFLQGVSVANYADSGESSGSFLGSSAMFGAIKSRWRSGDWFFVQLGHNDKTTTAATFQSNMTSFVTQAKAAGVNIVLITPISRVGYALADEHVNSTGANLPQIIRDLGKSESVPVIDLTVTTWNWIQTITPKDYFAADSSASGGYDHTHLGPEGADTVAGFVRDAIKANPGVPALVPYLR